jgi:hypothetical protein
VLLPPCYRYCPVANQTRAHDARLRRRGFGVSIVPILLALLALLDLRVELQLLADHFTLTSLAAAIRNHLLATAVLLFFPSLLHHYRQKH